MGVYEELVCALKSAGPQPLWPPFRRLEDVGARVLAVPPPDLLGGTIRQPEMASAVAAGLLLWAGFLDESHCLSQENPTATGSYWHAIMHRMEPDYGNSRYWVGRTGQHPAYPVVHAEVLKALGSDESDAARKLTGVVRLWGGWDPDRFISLVEASRGQSPAEVRVLETAQCAEMAALLDWCREQALAQGPGAM